MAQNLLIKLSIVGLVLLIGIAALYGKKTLVQYELNTNYFSPAQTDGGNSNFEEQVLIPTLTSTPTPVPNQVLGETENNNLDFSEWIYPESEVLKNEGNEIILESVDDSDDITSFYQSKIISLGFNVKSFVKTKTNGNILNKLVAAKQDLEVRVEIAKQSDNTPSKITILKIEG